MTVNRETEAKAPPLFDPADVCRIRADPAVLERFYLAFYDDVVRYLTRRVREPQDVADLVADTFVGAVDAAEGYNHRRGQALPWLIGIAHNKLRRWYRQQGSDQALARRVGGRRLLDADDITDLEDRLDAAAQAPFAAFNRLSPEERELLDLVEIQRFTPAELAVVLGVSAGVARVRLHRARRALRRAADLPPHQEEEK